MAENDPAGALKELNDDFEKSKTDLLFRFLKDQEDITKKLDEYDLSSEEDVVFVASEPVDIISRTENKKKSKHRKQFIRVDIRPKTATGFRGAYVPDDENVDLPPPPRPSPEPVHSTTRRDSSTCACASVDSSYKHSGRTSSIGQLSNASYDGYARSNNLRSLKTRHISVDDPSYMGPNENRYFRRQNSNSAILLKKSQTIGGISMSVAESPNKPISVLKLPPLTDGAIVSQPLARANLVSGRH